MTGREYRLVNPFDFCSNRGLKEYELSQEMDFSELIRNRNLESGTIVDLGCGNGFFLRDIVRIFPSIRGIGVDKMDYVNHAPEFHKCDLRSLDLPSESADLVVSNVAFQYIRQDPELAYQEAYRIMKSGGMGIIYPFKISEDLLKEAIPKARFEVRTLNLKPMNVPNKQLVLFRD